MFLGAGGAAATVLLAAGAQIESEPVDQPYGQREYGVRYPEGHRWWFVTPVASRR